MLYFIQIYRYLKVLRNFHVAVFFETSVLKEVCVLYPLSPQYYNNIVNTKGPQQSFYLIDLLIGFFYSFSF